jgi:hypothetical protein
MITLYHSDVQDLAEIIYEYIRTASSMHEEIDALAKRFNIPLNLTYGKHSIAARNRVRAMLENINGSDKLIQLVAYLVQTRVSSNNVHMIDKLNRIFTKYGYMVSVSGDEVALLPTTCKMLAELQKKQSSWVEENAPKEVIDYLRRAREKLGEGAWEECILMCRKALEALTITGTFSESLHELVRKNIITKGQKNRKEDFELLTAIYGFCSTVGAHIEGARLASEDRARLALQTTDGAVYFLVRKIKEAEEKNIILDEWRKIEQTNESS